MSKQIDFYAEAYGKGLPPDDRMVKVLRLANTLTAESLLDIGCGDGTISLALKSAFGAKEVFGIEISAVGAEEARMKGIVCYELNVDDVSLPFRDSSVDAIYAGEIIEHLYDPDHLLDEITRVLHPTGFAIIDTPNLAWWADRLSLFFGYQPQSTESSLRFGYAGKLITPSIAGGGGHLRILTLRAFRKLLERHGLNVRRIIGARGKTTSPTSLPPLLRPAYLAVDGVLSRFPSLSQFIIAVVDKSRRGPRRSAG